MKRTNIFEILEEKNRNSMGKNFERIYKLYDEYWFCADQNIEITLNEFVNLYSFNSWKNKGRCIDLDDFLTFIEIIYNFYYMSKNYMKFFNNRFKFNTEMHQLKDLMDICLSDYNYSAFYNKEKEQVIVVEDNPEAVSVAENLEPEIAFDVIRYNHHTLKGDIKTKKHILTIMGSELEPKRKQLKPINGDLEDAIFFILNNANIRHNNISETDKNYRKFIANMSDVELEELYDELYEMMLLANLELENTERMPKMKQLKKDITSNT